VFGAWTGKKWETKTAASPAHPRGRRVYLVHVPGAVQTQSLQDATHHAKKSGLGEGGTHE